MEKSTQKAMNKKRHRNNFQHKKNHFDNNKKSSSDLEDEDLTLTPTTKKWFEELSDDPKDIKPVTDQILIELKDEAKKCLDSVVAKYNIKNAKTNQNYQWMKTIMSKGTVSDKIAAYTVAIQDNPLCTLEMLRSMVNMVKVGKKKECIAVTDTLTELFLSDLLRPDSKLRPFHQRPLAHLNELSSGNALTREKLLSNWYFEDQLKELYTMFVLALNKVAQDTIDNNKEKAIGAMFKLLAGNPEQEKNLLAYIVNKLGDPSQKVASKAIYTLGQLLFQHPNMQGVVLNELEKLLFRPNISSKAQYYGLCFLSQFYLSHDANEIARRLIELYFSFFKACVKKGDVDSRMMSALLMGVNRAYPYAKLEFDKISQHIDTMYRVVHFANFNNSLHALSLLYQVSDQNNSVCDRFYSALYKKLIDPKLFTTTHQAMLLSLVYKALIKDTEISRVKVFVKRLLQIALFTQPSFACGILYSVSQLMGKKQDLQSLILKQSRLNGTDDNDDEERYHDVKDTQNEKEGDERELNKEDIKPDVKALDESISKSSWFHCANSTNKDTNKSLQYNPLSRNPLYAGGEYCAYVELANLKSHFHPSVALYATNISEGNLIKYSGDPLKDFTLIRFLDRFVFKNPKKGESTSGAHPTFGKRKNYAPRGVRSLPVNSASYLNENSSNIPVDELFMYRYLQKKHSTRRVKEEEDSDLESVQSDEFEDMLDKITGASKGEDLDFLNDIGDNFKSKSAKYKDKNAKDETEEEISEGDLSNEEMSLDEDEFDEDLQGDDLDMDEDDKELLDGLESDEDEAIVFDDEKPQKGKRKSNKNDISTLFASAEEFASLLDEEGSSKIAPGGSNTFSNKDNANVKQLAWEDKRNRWVNNFNNSERKFKSSKNKNFKKKRSNDGKFENKAKKLKT